MTRPTKHPKSGVYRVRLVIPQGLRETAKATFGVRRELVRSLGTKDGAEARKLAPSAIAGLQERLDAIRAAHEGREVPMSEQAVQALAGLFYRSEIDKHGANPGSAQTWVATQDFLLNQADIVDREPWEDPSEPDHSYTPVVLEEDRPRATQLVVDAGHTPSPANVERVAR